MLSMLGPYERDWPLNALARPDLATSSRQALCDQDRDQTTMADSLAIR